jgi:hydroxymethylglutaryl-CoA lyase
MQKHAAEGRRFHWFTFTPPPGYAVAVMPDLVRITDVSPRDGLQNEPGIIPTPDKVRLIELLCQTGVDEIEMTSFVSPKWVPQLGDAAEVVRMLSQIPLPQREGKSGARPVFSALVPNERGLATVIECNQIFGRQVINKVAVVTAASETFCKKNLNCTIAESIDRILPIVERCQREGLAVRGYISCAVACPFEGPIDPKVVEQWAFVLADMGIHDVDLGDTIGHGTNDSTQALLDEVLAGFEAEETDAEITMHFHDTAGRAAECVRAALDLGVRSFDGSVAGLGGCPYASKTLPDGTIQRAPGNISTELLVQTIHDAGYRTNVDLDKLREAAAFAREIVAKSRATGASSGGSGGRPA